MQDWQTPLPPLKNQNDIAETIENQKQTIQTPDKILKTRIITYQIGGDTQRVSIGDVVRGKGRYAFESEDFTDL